MTVYVSSPKFLVGDQVDFRLKIVGMIFVFCIYFFIPSVSIAETTQIPESTFQKTLQKAQESLLKEDKKKFDFYAARYMGFASRDTSGSHGVKDLEALLKERKPASIWTTGICNLQAVKEPARVVLVSP